MRLGFFVVWNLARGIVLAEPLSFYMLLDTNCRNTLFGSHLRWSLRWTLLDPARPGGELYSSQLARTPTLLIFANICKHFDDFWSNAGCPESIQESHFCLYLANILQTFEARLVVQMAYRNIIFANICQHFEDFWSNAGCPEGIQESHFC